MQAPWYTNLDSLQAAGFTGFHTIGELRTSSLKEVPRQKGDIGVYMVLRPSTEKPTFLAQSTGGRFKQRNPSVSQDVLLDNWVPGASIVYIGKAGAPGKSATLRSRLKQYLDFGAGRAVGHWGGRLIWHLPSSDELLVCWKLTRDESPREIEKTMIAEFCSAFGRLPFANLTG